ncbi:MAG TPA: DinB family protein [Thermomicrobiales bacterium]|nr:DinB family protein [Thermomicrobiales bacterium]
MRGSTRLEWIRESFAYDDWARERILAAARKLDPDALVRDFGSSFPSILATLIHMVQADWTWLRRWTGESASAQTTGPADLDAVEASWTELARARWRFIENLTDADLDRTIRHQTSTGQIFEMPLGQMMRHVVNHATYHRGQVVTMLRQAGQVPPSTDLIRYFRELP